MPKNIVGFYSLRSNRVNMYDLTGMEPLRTGNEKRGNLAQINQILSHPEAESMVATVIHEATHQIAFNCGLEQRFADVPLWLSEGLAMYFETPDLNSTKGWRTLGEVNRPRLARFREYLPRRPANSLVSLISEDTAAARSAHIARCVRRSLGAHVLSAAAARQGVSGVHGAAIGEGADGVGRSGAAAERISACFGDDLSALDAEFLRYMQRVK